MNKKNFVLPSLALVIGIGGGYWLAGGSNENAPMEMTGTTVSQEREVLFYRNPMNPAITSPVFMQDEMGMDYIPVYADGGSAGEEPVGTVTIDPVTVQNIGVRTSFAQIQTISRDIYALGRVDFNEQRLARLHPKTSGWIEELRVDETGTRVKNDTILLSIYSPDLVAAQQEFLVALSNWERAKSNVTRKVMESARERLELFDVPAHQIHELEQDRKVKKYIHIHSPFNGRVMHIGTREGQYVSPKDELYLIADLSRIWVYVDVFEDELAWIKEGDKVEVSVRAAPGEKLEGKVSFIYPTLDKQTRAVRLRLEFDNPDLTLKPGMFADVVLHASPQDNALVVPSESIVRSGTREQVFIAKGEGKFEPHEVTVGLSANGMTQVISGIDVGDVVVTSGQFLIDSESKLREATAKMMAVSVDHSDYMGHDMSMDDMDMSDMAMDDVHGRASVAGDRTSGATDLDMNDMDMSDMEMGQ